MSTEEGVVMVDLGQWNSHVNVNEMLGWYSLHGPLKKALATYEPDGHEFTPWPSSRFSKLKREAEVYADRSVAGFYVPHHNLKMHFRPVAELGAQAAKHLGLPQPVQQLLYIALLTHDAHHCGATLRKHAKRLSLPHYGRGKSTEWVTAAAVDEEFSVPHGFVVPARLFMTYVHWSSTIGGNSPDGRGLPSPKPKLIAGRIMRAADVCPPQGFMNCVRQAINVRFLEIPAEPREYTWQWFIEDNLGFCNYVDHCFSQLGSCTQSLGWNNRVKVFRDGLEQCRDRSSALAKKVDEEFRKHGIVLS